MHGPWNDPRRFRLAVTSERRADEPWDHDRTRTQKHPLPRAPTPSLDETGDRRGARRGSFLPGTGRTVCPCGAERRQKRIFPSPGPVTWSS